MTATVATNYYWRCADCLGGFVTGETFGGETPTLCTLCGGPVRLLGPVDAAGARWLNFIELSPCDHRCTHARGRRCECECNGRAHGSALVIVAERVGGAVRMTPSFDTKGAIERAEEFRAIRKQLREVLNTKFGRYWPAYWQANYAELAEMASHQGRMKRAARLLREAKNS